MLWLELGVRLRSPGLRIRKLDQEDLAALAPIPLQTKHVNKIFDKKYRFSWARTNTLENAQSRGWPVRLWEYCAQRPERMSDGSSLESRRSSVQPFCNTSTRHKSMKYVNNTPKKVSMSRNERVTRELKHEAHIQRENEPRTESVDASEAGEAERGFIFKKSF